MQKSIEFVENQKAEREQKFIPEILEECKPLMLELLGKEYESSRDKYLNDFINGATFKNLKTVFTVFVFSLVIANMISYSDESFFVLGISFIMYVLIMIFYSGNFFSYNCFLKKKLVERFSLKENLPIEELCKNTLIALSIFDSSDDLKEYYKNENKVLDFSGDFKRILKETESSDLRKKIFFFLDESLLTYHNAKKEEFSREKNGVKTPWLEKYHK